MKALEAHILGEVLSSTGPWALKLMLPLVLHTIHPPEQSLKLYPFFSIFAGDPAYLLYAGHVAFPSFYLLINSHFGTVCN